MTPNDIINTLDPDKWQCHNCKEWFTPNRKMILINLFSKPFCPNCWFNYDELLITPPKG